MALGTSAFSAIELKIMPKQSRNISFANCAALTLIGEAGGYFILGGDHLSRL